jgi:hypothetical protein
MPKGWWILPSAVCGGAMWVYAGWTVYEALQGSPTQNPTIEAPAPEATPQALIAQEDGTTSRAPRIPPGTWLE